MKYSTTLGVRRDFFRRASERSKVVYMACDHLTKNILLVTEVQPVLRKLNLSSP